MERAKVKLFDAVTRILLCGAAVVLLTALAIPELIDLGLEEELVKDFWAPMLSAVVVTVLYAILFAGPRMRKFGKPKADGGKILLVVFLSSVLAGIAVSSLDTDGTELDWLPTALGVAIMTMGQAALAEWQILELESGKQAGE